MAVADFVYDNWGNVFETTILYDEIPVRYELETSTGVIVIDEPLNWQAVPFVHKRDREYFGFNYEFTGAELSLGFDCDAGSEAIALEYKTNGNDGKVLFRKILEYTTDIIEYEGKLNLNVLKWKENSYEATVERTSLHELVKNRLNTKVNIEDDQDLDGNYAPTYSHTIVQLPGQNISEKFQSATNEVREETFTETRTGDETVYGIFDFADPTVNTMKGFIGNTLGISGDPNAVGMGDLAIFDFTADGTYNIEISLDFQVKVSIQPRFFGWGKEINEAFINTTLRIAPETGTHRVYQIHNIPTWNPDLQNVTYPRVTVTANFEDVEVNPGDRLMIVATIRYGHNANKLKSVKVTIKQYSTSLKINGSSIGEPTAAESWLIKDAMEAVLLRMLGQADVLKTDFYSMADEDHAVNGCGAERVLTNGGHLRLAPDNKYPLTTTFKEMLTSMHAIDCIGMGYEWDAENQKEIIRVEPQEYFFKDVETFLIEEDIGDYEVETARELIYNAITVGYDKYKEEEANSYDEIHAYHEYQTPIKNEGEKYSMLSKYNASGYLIEIARRLFFAENRFEAGPYDDDIFIIHVHVPEEIPHHAIAMPITEEPFSDISGIIDPATTLNMTLSPKRMLLAHSRWLMSSLIYKNAAEIIKSTFVKQNKEFSTTLAEGYSCPRGDVEKLPLVANADVILGAFGDFAGIYSPEWVTFNVRMRMADVRYIINAHRGLSPDDNNYGYLTYTDDQGIVCKGWLYELTYSRGSERVSFKLLKKKFP
jgi:hypothetical protein